MADQVRHTVYIVFRPNGEPDRMTKRQPELTRGERLARLDLLVPRNLRPPIVIREVSITSWSDWDLQDIEIKQNIITESEAAVLRASRLRKLAALLESEGAVIEWPDKECTHGDDCERHPGGQGCDG